MGQLRTFGVPIRTGARYAGCGCMKDPRPAKQWLIELVLSCLKEPPRTGVFDLDIQYLTSKPGPSHSTRYYLLYHLNRICEDGSKTASLAYRRGLISSSMPHVWRVHEDLQHVCARSPRALAWAIKQTITLIGDDAKIN